MAAQPYAYKVMLVGVVPPPLHGQSLATKVLFESDLSPIKPIIVEIRSSTRLTEIGKFSFKKLLGIANVIGQTYKLWLIHRPKTLYYTAGSGAWVPFARDLIFLCLCRPLFSKVLIHFHSGNLPEFLEGSALRSWLGRYIYGRGVWTIRLGNFCPAPYYPGNERFEVPNGIDAPTILPTRISSTPFRILFLGNLFEEKGVIDLLEAVHLFAADYRGLITLSLVGGWPSDGSRQKIESLIASLPANVNCPPPAPAYGSAKWQALAEQDVFAFPSYYSSENFPLVIIEAMAASLPVLASDWRGIKSLVSNEITGLLVPPRDVKALASSLKRLADNPQERRSMGNAGRLHYEQHLTGRAHLTLMRQILIRAAETA